MAFKLLDRARMSVSGAPGTGNITLGSAALGYQTFTQAGANDDDTFPYSITDGVNWEYGVATYLSAGNTLVRDVTKTSAQDDAPLSLSNAALISATVRAEDINPTSVASSLAVDNNGTAVATGVATLNFVNATSITASDDDVTITLPSGDGGSSTLADLSDVDVSTPADDNVLIYHTGSSKWENGSLATVAFTGEYSSLSGAPTIPGNSSFDLASLGDVSVTTGSGVDGYSLTWNNTAGKFELTDISGGGGGGSSLTVSNNGTVVDSAATTLNFVNATSITTSSHDVTITLPSSGGGGGSTIYGIMVPPVAADLTAETNKTGSETITQRTTGAIPNLSIGTTSATQGNTIYYMAEAVIGSTFMLTAKVMQSDLDSGYPGGGLMVYNSANGYMESCFINGAGTFYAFAWTSTTSNSAHGSGNVQNQDWFQHLWSDGTNIYFGISRDGVGIQTLQTAAISGGIGAVTHAGICWGGDGSARDINFFHYAQETSGSGLTSITT